MLGAIDYNATATFALPAALAEGLFNGNYHGIILYADDTGVMSGKNYSTNYATFSPTAPIAITYES